jgi:hypothetical protein
MLFNDMEERLQCCEAFRTASGINYLENSGVEIYLHGRTIKVWGLSGSLATTPQTCFGYSWKTRARSSLTQTYYYLWTTSWLDGR